MLSVNQLMYDAFAKEPLKKGVIFYAYQLLEAGPKRSKFKLPPGENWAPNSLVIPIPRGGKARVGDTVLTWWQSGSGMQRGYVVDAQDPTQPVVRYLDLAYDNPAKSPDKKTTIGQMEEKLKPDSFVVLTQPFQVGSTVACKEGKEQLVGAVVRVAGEKLLMTGFVGQLSVRNKSDCTPLPSSPKVAEGDKLLVESIGKLRLATVLKVDQRIGRVFAKTEGITGKESAFAFGRVLPQP